MAEFFHMGGYALYVWSSFAVSVLVLGALIWQSQRAYRRELKTLKALEQTVQAKDTPGHV